MLRRATSTPGPGRAVTARRGRVHLRVLTLVSATAALWVGALHPAGAPSRAALPDGSQVVVCPRAQIVLIGHAGTGRSTRTIDGRLFSENTIPAFRKALAVGADGFEADYRASDDGRLVSHHDATLERMTSGTGLVRGRPWSYLRRLSNPSAAPVVTAAQVEHALATWGGHRQQEIKQGLPGRMLRTLLRIDQERLSNYPSALLVTSAELRTLSRVHHVDRRVPLGLISRSPKGRPGIANLPRWLDVLLIDYTAADEHYISRARAAGLQVSLRNVDTLHRLHRAVALGATRAVTNRPELLGRAC